MTPTWLVLRYKRLDNIPLHMRHDVIVLYYMCVCVWIKCGLKNTFQILVHSKVYTSYNFPNLVFPNDFFLWVVLCNSEAGLTNIFMNLLELPVYSVYRCSTLMIIKADIISTTETKQLHETWWPNKMYNSTPSKIWKCDWPRRKKWKLV